MMRAAKMIRKMMDWSINAPAHVRNAHMEEIVATIQQVLEENTEESMGVALLDALAEASECMGIPVEDE